MFKWVSTFSSCRRYAKVPVFDKTYTARTAIAFDLMRVDFKALPRLPSLLPAVRTLFKDLEEEEDAADAAAAANMEGGGPP